MYLAVLSTLMSLLVACDSARILAMVAFPARSHWIPMEPLFLELAARGHQLTIVTPFSQKKPVVNFTVIDVSDILPPIISQFSIELIKFKMPSPWKTPFFMNEIDNATCKLFEDPRIKKLTKAKGQFDLVITELFGDDCFVYLSHLLEVPLISITTSVSLPWAADRVGLPDNPAYIPNYLTEFTPNMNLWERLYNAALMLNAKFWFTSLFNKNTQSNVEKMLGLSLPPIEEVVSKTSLLLVNSYHSLAQSRPFPPNVIEVGGMHIKKAQPIPQDLKSILDKAKQGAIVMSFGSLVRTATLPKNIIMDFMTAFSKIPQIVIFKYEEDLPEAPPNVIIRKWLPQRDLVEHENVVAVIAHGGLASTIESVYLGKPIIGIPFFGDQKVNINSIVRRGAGVQLNLDEISEKKISEALSQILTNPQYRENMKQLSTLFRDRPMSALETAVYWTEYVIRHKGAPHLRPASVDLSFYQYLLLDVVAVLLGSVIIVLTTLYVLSKYLLSVVTGKNRSQIIKEKKLK